MDLFVVLLNVGRQVPEEVGGGVYGVGAAVMGTQHFLKAFDFVDGVVVQAGFAEPVLVLAVAEVHLPVLPLRLFDIPLTDLAGRLLSVQRVFQLGLQHASNPRLPDPRLLLLFAVGPRLGHLSPQNALQNLGDPLFGLKEDAQRSSVFAPFLGYPLIGLPFDVGLFGDHSALRFLQLHFSILILQPPFDHSFADQSHLILSPSLTMLQKD